MAYLANHPARFTQPAILTFEQVFLGPPGAVRTWYGLPRSPASRCAAAPIPSHSASRHCWRATWRDTPADLVARDFGDAFATALEQAPVGEWTGPVESSFGTHYVRVAQRTPAAVPDSSAVRDQVIREWENDRRQRARAEAYARMRAGYDISVEAALPGREQ